MKSNQKTLFLEIEGHLFYMGDAITHLPMNCPTDAKGAVVWFIKRGGHI